MSVPDYCLCQSLNDFTSEQIEEDREMMKEYYASERYKYFREQMYINQGYKKTTIRCASGTYPTWTKGDLL